VGNGAVSPPVGVGLIAAPAYTSAVHFTSRLGRGLMTCADTACDPTALRATTISAIRRLRIVRAVSVSRELFSVRTARVAAARGR
jgi:hypothetical protein